MIGTNIPVRKDALGKIVVGSYDRHFPNRRTRREMIQKKANNPMFGLSTHTHYTQKVYNKKKDRVITIVHQIFD